MYNWWSKIISLTGDLCFSEKPVQIRPYLWFVFIYLFVIVFGGLSMVNYFCVALGNLKTALDKLS